MFSGEYTAIATSKLLVNMMTTKGTLPMEALSVITGKIDWELILCVLM